jgi:hypothetical protein
LPGQKKGISVRTGSDFGGSLARYVGDAKKLRTGNASRKKKAYKEFEWVPTPPSGEFLPGNSYESTVITDDLIVNAEQEARIMKQLVREGYS